MNRIIQTRWQVVLFSLAVPLALVFLSSLTLAATGRISQPPMPQAPQATPDPGDNWGNEKIGADLLWQSGYTGEGVTVAVSYNIANH